MRDEGVPRVARQQNDPGAAAFRCGDEIFSAQLIPAIGLGPLLEPVMRINNPRDAGIAILLWSEREGMVAAPAKISAQEGANPRAAAFGNRNHDGVTAGQFPGPAAQVPADYSRHESPRALRATLSPRPARPQWRFLR